ncbi:MAG: hypothetical protein IJ868_00530 [Prevotella sp.]|nr:hypothetical protein [Prevotella sp.]
MRTDGTKAPSISSDNVLRLHCPASWGELSQEQLRYVLSLIGSNLYSDVEIRTMALIRFCGITVIKRHSGGLWSCSIELDSRKTHYFDLLAWQVQDMIGQLGFINSPEDMDIRLEAIQGYRAVDGLLHGLNLKDGVDRPFPFYDYINMEVCYQGFLMSRSDKAVRKMSTYLYRDERGEKPESLDLDTAELTGTLFWYVHIKKELAHHFTNFFRQATAGGALSQTSILDSVNAQLRALTDGDVTKEEQVKQTDCWRALTELDAKAREAEEYKRKYGNK